MVKTYLQKIPPGFTFFSYNPILEKTHMKTCVSSASWRKTHATSHRSYTHHR